ncbi:hypothetical protein Tco_0432030 [Tanacetum coccineum]
MRVNTHVAKENQKVSKRKQKGAKRKQEKPFKDLFGTYSASVARFIKLAAGGNLSRYIALESCLKNIMRAKSKVRQSRSKAIVSKVSMSSSTPAVSSDVAELKDMVRALIIDKKNQAPAPAPVKAVKQSCVTCGGGHSYQNCPATNGNIYRDKYLDTSVHMLRS